VDLVESGVTSGLDKKLSYRDVILVRDLGNSFVALMYVFVLSVFMLSRRMAQACTIVMLLLQFAALLTAGMFLWETERGIVAIIALYGAYVLFYTVCTLLQRLAICATAIMTYIVMKATLCDSSVEALQNVGFLVIFIASMTCSVWLQEHLSHVFHFEQRVATKCLDQIKDAKSVGAQLLTDLLPSHVVDLVRDGVSPIAETYDDVTILFTDIKGFTKFSASISPQRLCHVLNSMFSNFDEIISTWDLHKVEIIGDAYWVSAGCPAKPCLRDGADETKDKQKERAEFAMRAVEVALALLRALPSVCDDTSLQMRAGIHTGPVVAGVVGKKGPRYHLFGTTVGYAEKMESSGIPGRVQISDATHTLLEAGGHAYDYEERTVEIEEEEQPVPTWLVNKSNAREAIQIQKKLMEERRRQSS
jgi:class 3 adenylate cyclase